MAWLGYFLGRLVRVNGELTYTAAQMSRLQGLIAEWFATHDALTVGNFHGFTGASRKYAVPPHATHLQRGIPRPLRTAAPCPFEH